MRLKSPSCRTSSSLRCSCADSGRARSPSGVRALVMDAATRSWEANQTNATGQVADHCLESRARDRGEELLDVDVGHVVPVQDHLVRSIAAFLDGVAVLLELPTRRPVLQSAR